MTYQSTPISIDDREPNADSFSSGLKRRSISAKVEQLLHGDFRWVLTTVADGKNLTVVVERKTIQDLLNSVADGRLARFIDRPIGDDEMRILLLERSDRKLLKAGFKWKETGVDNVLLECQMRGVPVVSCQEGQVVDRIASLWKWTMQPQHRSAIKPRLASISNGYIDADKKRAVRVLMGVPGWGEVKASAALHALGNVYAVLDALKRRDYAAFRPVYGVGKSLVNNSADFLERPIK